MEKFKLNRRLTVVGCIYMRTNGCMHPLKDSFVIVVRWWVRFKLAVIQHRLTRSPSCLAIGCVWLPVVRMRVTPGS